MNPVRYIAPVYRPPSEADSLILPVTDGCSWNKCSFCEMYTSKSFRARKEDEVLESIRRCGQAYGTDVRRVFLADGDALVLPTRRLIAVLQAIREQIPSVRRVSSYCLARNLAKKSVGELQELKEAGLTLAYLGAESGDDDVLAKVNKGETFDTTREALAKLGEAGIKRSVMIINGLGGATHWEAHAENSARLANASQPEYLATLVLSFPLGEERFRAAWPDWRPLDIPGLLREMEHFISQLELERTVFRSDHASNWLVLKGNLPHDKEALLARLRGALSHPETAPLRPSWARGL